MNSSKLDKIVPQGNVCHHFYWNDRVELGSGSYAVVYKARRKSDDAELAVKCVEKARIQNPAQWQQLAHEVVISRYLNHPGCVKCLDAFQDPNHVFLVQEWVPGGDLLTAIMARKAEFTEDVVATFTRQILETLVYLHHEKGITHRDLKPDNILLTTRTLTEARLKFSDFGFAKFFGKLEDMSPHFGASLPSPDSIARMAVKSPVVGASVNLSFGGNTVLATPKGSVRYLAPEMIRHLSKYGCKPRVTTRPEIQKVDIYAVGVVVYVMLCGRFPYKGERVEDVCRSMETHHLTFPTSTLQYSESNKNFCRWLMEKDPQLRPLALQALRHEWLTCPTPTVPTTAKGQGSFADALLAMEDMPKLDAVRRQESDLDKDGYEPSPDVVAHIGPPPVPDPSALEDSRPIPIRGSALGFQLNTSKIPKRNPKPTAAI